jgi:probable rRNA maturation factor
LEISETAECAIVLTDDEEIRGLNAEWRGIDESTDVLSFAMQEAEDAALTPDVLGDVVVSVQTATRLVEAGVHRERVYPAEHSATTWGLGEELLFLIVHGVLHLLGHDHAEREEEAEMREEERRIVAHVLQAQGSAPKVRGWPVG